MKELSKIAADYAAEKTNEVMTTAIAQAYADGYRDGYKDREEEIPVNLRIDKTEFVDLGLPSGTLWALDYVKENDIIKYFPYDKASMLTLPTEEQWKELFAKCRWEYKGHHDKAKRNMACVGPNGNYIYFNYNGIIKDGDDPINFDYARFWLKDESGESERNVMYLFGELDDHFNWKYKSILKKVYEGYKLPVRLVC